MRRNLRHALHRRALPAAHRVPRGEVLQRRREEQEHASLRAILLTLAAALLVMPAVTPTPLQALVAPLSAASALVAAWRLDKAPILSRRLATAATLAPLAVWLPTAVDTPILGLILIIGAMMVLGRVHPPPALLEFDGLDAPDRAVRPAAWLSLVVCVMSWFRSWEDGIIPATATLTAGMLPGLLMLYREGLSRGDRRIGILTTTMGGVLGVLYLATGSIASIRLAPVMPFAVLLTSTEGDENEEETSLLGAFLGHPPRLLVLSFASLCAIGALLLSLPAADAQGRGHSFLDALFTATSAACVTGLAVLDTPVDLSPFGQAVVLLLIQAGGLGIMTFAAAAFVLFGRRLGVREEGTAVGLLGASDRSDVASALVRVFEVTALTEAVGATVLAVLFRMAGDSWGQAIWRGVFTSISAFCNAGFALQSDSLVPYQGNLPVLFTVSTLIVVGGLGPAVVVAVPRWIRTGRARLHTRLVIAMTALLIVIPFVAFTAFEWSHALAHLPTHQRLANALFQSITLRTAGFNSVDITQVQPATWTLMMAAMFVGGSPGSTAGGVKTTTVAVVGLEVWSTIRGRRQVRTFARRLPTSVVREAIAIVVVGALSAAGLLVALQLTQRMALDVALFEAMSALATVGLTIGGTARLDEIGKILIVVAMFAGRVGPLTLLLFLQDEEDPLQDPRMPQEAVPVG